MKGQNTETGGRTVPQAEHERAYRRAVEALRRGDDQREVINRLRADYGKVKTICA